MIDYLCDVMNHINFVCMIISIFSGVYLFLCIFMDQNFVYKKQIIITFIISTLLCIFIPTNLKWQIADKYIEKNKQLETQLIQAQVKILELQKNENN